MARFRQGSEMISCSHWGLFEQGVEFQLVPPPLFPYSRDIANVPRVLELVEIDPSADYIINCSYDAKYLHD